jgi:Fe-S cluster assembly protein SufD
MNNENLAILAEQNLAMSTGVLKDFRATHLELFKKQGIKHDPESYKFTNLNSFMENLKFSPYETAHLNLDKYQDEKFHTLFFLDGEIQQTSSKIPGVSFHSLETEFHRLAGELKDTHPLSHLHHALLGSGVVIEIEKNTKLQKPVRLFHLVTKSGVLAPTIFIKLHAMSEASILEENYDLNVGHSFLGETYIQVDQGASLEHVQIVVGGEESLLHSQNQTYLQRDAKYRNVILNLGGKLNRRNVNLELLESGAHAESYNLYLTNQTEHSDISTVIQHKAADTTSDQIAKGILDGDSKGIFTGKIHIHPKAQRVASGQLNKNLLLSKKAQAHSQPQLEIFADDVKCSHGSTTGQLSDDEVFYFQARGIPADKARTILAHGFGLEVVLKISDPEIRNKAEAMVMDALKNKFKIGGQG